MLDILFIELLKLKKTKILVLISAAIILPYIFTCLFLYTRRMYPLTNWDEFFALTGQFMNCFTPALFIFIAGFILTREFRDNTISVLFTFPAAIYKLYAGKLIILTFSVIVTYLFSFILKLWVGLTIINENIPVWVVFRDMNVNIFVIVLNILLLPFSIAVCLITRKEIATTIFGVSILIIMQFLSMTRFNVYFPWNAPLIAAGRMGYTANGMKLVSLDGNFSHMLVTLIITVIVMITFNIIYIRKAEI